MRHNLRRRQFEAAITPHLNGAYNLARWLCGNGWDAEDIVQEAVLRAYRYFDSWRGGDARVWLLSIVRNSYRSWLQQNRSSRATYGSDGQTRPEPDELVEVAEDHDPEGSLIREQDRARLAELVSGLPPELREVTVLRDLQELSFREVAAITGAPIATVQSRLARARATLREQWPKGDC